MPKVLVVDDEEMVRDVLSRYLLREGFDVVTAADGEEAVRRAGRGRPDLVLLDLMLPKKSGVEVLEALRGSDPPAVIILTAKDGEEDRIAGLDRGADDYITKPFSPREVISRVNAVLRRTGARDLPLETAGLRIDPARREVWVRGERVTATRKEFDLLHLLATNPGIAFSRTRLLEEVWDYSWSGDDSTVTVHIRRLREKIEEDPSHPRHLITVWGIGYRFDP